MNEKRHAPEKEYLQAVYVVNTETMEIRFHIGENSDAVNRLLGEHDATSFAFITAFNPRSEILTNDENERRQAELKENLRRENLDFLKGYGTDERELWQRETSFFVFDIARDKAARIGRKYEQNAIVCGAKDEEIELVWCD